MSRFLDATPSLVLWLTLLVAQAIESWVQKHMTEPMRPSLRPKAKTLVAYLSVNAQR